MTRAVDCVELFRVHRTAEGDAAALQGLTLHVDPGELVACLGPSGSGKSTLLRVLAGLEPASAGRAAVLGHELGRLRARRRAVLRRALLGFVDQHPEQALPPDLPVAEGIALGLGLRGVSARSARARVAELLERVGLDGHGGTRPSELSGGELQRAAVCAAIAHRPPLVLADEPTGELDASTAAAVLELLVGLAREDGAAILLVTHDPAAAALADRTLAVRDGRLSDERRNGVHAAVVARGGWLRVPEAVLARAGITDRALVELSGAGVLLRPPDPAVARSAEGPHAPRAAPSSGASAAVTATVEAVTRRYGERVVLPPTTADFAPSSFTAIVGRSGSGKTTLLRILAGLDPVDGGRVCVDGTELAALDRDARAALRADRVAVVGQGLTLAPHLSALEQAGPEAEPWLAALGITERARQPVGRLSGGERQRVALARALASGRGLLLLDEPSSRLDEASASRVAELLRAAASEHGRTVVVTTHDPILAARATSTLPLG